MKMENLKENVKYEALAYSVDANIDEADEVEFLENIVSDFIASKDMSTSIEDRFNVFYQYSFEKKLSIAPYIESHIDDFICSCSIDSLRQALDGGIREYLYKQFFSNTNAIYTNILYHMLNENPDGLHSDLDPQLVEDIVEDFIGIELSDIICSDKYSTLYKSFCEFLAKSLEE